MSQAHESGYRDCACRDCFDVAIGPLGTMCHACAEAGCDAFYTECQRLDAYGMEQDESDASPVRCLTCGTESVAVGSQAPGSTFVDSCATCGEAREHVVIGPTAGGDA